MSPSHVLAPTYEEIKRRLLAGVWPSGFKLEAMQLAKDLGVSMSPVRDSLNRLMGERMVEAVAGQGFCVVRLDEPSLRDLLDFNLELVRLAATSIAFTPTSAQGMDHASRTAAMFLSVAQGNGNKELSLAVGNLNDRLHAVRRLDSIILTDVTSELDDLESALFSKARHSQISDMLISYHVRRKAKADQYLRLLARADHG